MFIKLRRTKDNKLILINTISISNIFKAEGDDTTHVYYSGCSRYDTVFESPEDIALLLEKNRLIIF